MSTTAPNNDKWHGFILRDPTATPRLVRLIEGLELADGCVTLIAGAPHSGRTMFALLASLCIANGVPLLGAATQRRPVIYLNHENTDDTERKRWRIAEGIDVDPASIHLVRAQGLAINGGDFTAGVVELAKLLADTHCVAPVVVIDSLPAAVNDYQRNGGMALRAFIREVHRVTRSAILPVVSSTLPVTEPPDMYNIDGPMHVVAACDTVLGVYQTRSSCAVYNARTFNGPAAKPSTTL